MIRQTQRVLTTSQLRSLEAAWIELCHPNWGMVLMEQAGMQAAELAMEMWKDGPGTVVVVCGRGNNGGDGLVIARHLHRFGAGVSVFMIAGTKQGAPLRSETQANLHILERMGIPIAQVDAEDMEDLESALDESCLVVDALLGTGLDRDVESTYAHVIEAINRSAKPVLAVDVPSGINSDTGVEMGTAVRAWRTATFGYLKAGLLCYPGADFAGEIELVDIGLPSADELPSELNSLTELLHRPRWLLLTAETTRDLLPYRPQDSHKGTFGELLCVAGSPGMGGAALLASRTALKTGVGISRLCAPRSLLFQLPPGEVIYIGVDETAEQTISPAAWKKIQGQFKRSSAICLGPGISEDDETCKFVVDFINRIELPCVIDADALNAIARDADKFPKDGSEFVLTPHPKELSRLLDIGVAEIQSKRLHYVQAAAKKFGCTVVLKGARSVVAHPDGDVAIIPTGNSGMATAGAGDVLSGVIGGLLAQSLPPFTAAAVGAYIHGVAGDLAAEALGEDGLVAGDIVDYVPQAIKTLRSEEFLRSPLEEQILMSAPAFNLVLSFFRAGEQKVKAMTPNKKEEDRGG
jgi:NAD(P)H-hydrate epimerase